jgi:prepilin-type N-terminal cleavage/methylation domain-containing protein
MRGDAGMTLIEMSMAMAMFALVAAALTAALGAGLRAVVVARQNLVARTAAEDTLEEMRALPFYENRATNPTNVDFLDLWFPDAQAGTEDGGYDATSMTYTSVTKLDGLTNGMMSVEAKFVVDTTGQPIAPSERYDHTDPTADTPPSRLMDVVITVSWEMLGSDRSFELTSTVGSKKFPGTLGRSDGTVAALSVSTGVQAPTGSQVYTVTLDGPQANTSTFLGDMSRASSNATAAKATSTLDDGTSCSTTGAESSATAPPTDGGTALATAFAARHEIPCKAGSRTVASIPATSIAGLSAGFPAPSNLPAADANAEMFPASPISTAGFSLFGDVVTDRRQISSTDASGDPVPLVGIDAPPAPPKVSALAGADEGSGASFDASVSAQRLGTVKVLPTAFAPAGVVQVDMTSASLQCSAVSGTGSSSATGSFLGTVKYWDAGAALDAAGQPNVSDDGYKSMTVVSGSGSDPVAALDPASVVVWREYGTDTLGKPVVLSELKLSDYVQSWRALHEVSVTSGVDGTVAAQADGIVSMVTAATVSGSPASQITLDVGNLTCSARDAR